jgi:hypothetical protein
MTRASDWSTAEGAIDTFQTAIATFSTAIDTFRTAQPNDIAEVHLRHIQSQIVLFSTSLDQVMGQSSDTL